MSSGMWVGLAVLAAVALYLLTRPSASVSLPSMDPAPEPQSVSGVKDVAARLSVQFTI